MELFNFWELVGKVLESDLVDIYGAIVIPKGKRIEAKDVQKAIQHPIQMIPQVKESTYREIITEVVNQLKEVFDNIRDGGKLPLEEIKKTILPSVEALVETPDVNQLMSQLREVDDYTVEHSVAVSVLASLLGKWVGLNDEDLSGLTQASILHDIGKMKVPPHILNKPGRLTPEEYNEIKQHTVYGYRLLKETPGVSHDQAMVALQHHERVDGTGYPSGVKADNISYWSKIVGIVDVFHAMSTKRVYHDALPLHSVLQELESGKFGSFDVEILNLFLLKMMQSLIGKQVILSNGEIGEVVLINDRNPTRPLIRCGAAFIDLNQNYAISMTRVINIA